MFGRRSSVPNASSTSKTPSNANTKLIFRNFLEFLETDIWSIPIMQFMEQNSIVFDREQGDPEVYRKVYKEFAKLVDTLIASYCQDSGISGQNLVEALKSTDKSSKLSYRERVLLEPVVAAQDFNVFVPMMMRKNIELQLQALKMLEHLSGLLPSSLTLADDDAEVWKVLFDEDESERLILISVLRQSKEEWERDQRNQEEWQEQLNAATHNSLREKELLEQMRKMEQKRMEDAMKSTEEKFKNMTIGKQVMIKEDPPKIIESPSKAMQKPNKAMEKEDVNEKPTQSALANKRMSLGNIRSRPQYNPPSSSNAADDDKYGYRSLLKERQGIPEEQLRLRAKYLREQRDKLMDKKRVEREKQLVESSKLAALDRPRTAKAASGALSRQMNFSGSSALDKEAEMDQRKAIVAKIKAAGVGNASPNKF